jgi:poly-gamma-glutamate capsule biosynthesis protein CapA/YwtB (metallophosphatase superfamily)
MIIRRRLVFLTLVVGVFLAIGGCQSVKTYSPIEQGKVPDQEIAKDSEPVPQLQKESITLTAVGDILMHNTLIWSGGQPDGSYQFKFFTEVKELIEQGDYATTNLETAIAGPATGYTGYPLFNSPDAIAKHLKDYGIDGVVTANNHILDRGYAGALRTVEVIRNSGLDTMGTKKNPEDSGFVIKEFRGVKVGYLAYTYGTNGIALPKEHSYFINILEKERILKDIKALRPQVDVLMLVLHWGVEYSPEPTEEQKILALQFLEAGADAIIGSHPHVIQSVEVVNIGGKDKFIAYSLGNFIGDQRGDERNSGVIVQLKFTQEKRKTQESSLGTDTFDKKTYLEEVILIPTYSHSYRVQGKQQFRVVPVEETIRKIKAGEEKILSVKDLPVLENVLRATQERLGQGN